MTEKLIRARLTTRHGTLVGYCDVRTQTTPDLPILPEVITIKGDGRTFVRNPDDRLDAAIRLEVSCPPPSYREQTFDWADNLGPAVWAAKFGAAL